MVLLLSMLSGRCVIRKSDVLVAKSRMQGPLLEAGMACRKAFFCLSIRVSIYFYKMLMDEQGASLKVSYSSPASPQNLAID